MFELVSENLTGLGGRMGTERTWTNFRKHFNSAANAKRHAERDYGKPIKWTKTNRGWRSPDLLHVMYHVKPLKTED